MAKSDNNYNKESKKKKKNPFSVYWIYGVAVVALIAFQFYWGSSSPVQIKSQATFFEMAEKGMIEKVYIVNNERIDFKLTEVGKEEIKKATKGEKEKMKEAFKLSERIPEKDPMFQMEIVDVGNFETKLSETSEGLKSQGKGDIPYEPKKEVDYFSSILGFLLPIIILILLWVFIMRRMSGGAGGGGGSQIFNIGKSKAQIYDKGKSTNTTFKDVAGLEGAKEEIVEIVEFLKNPKKYTELGAKIPKGALLVGPPGTGKTLLAKAVAGEAQVPFFSLSGSDFVEMFVGVGASRVRDLFKQAKEKAPAIIFID